MSIRKLLCSVIAGIIAIGVPFTARASYTFSVLHTFGSPGTTGDGLHPYAALVADGTGNLYGTTFTGGAYNHGTVFMLVKASNYSVAILHSFGAPPNASDGANPTSALLIDSQLNLYGTTRYGGTANDGVVFKLIHGATGWNESVLHTFSGPDGANPLAGLASDRFGNLYGTASQGGFRNGGVAYLLQPVSSGYIESTMYAFDSAKPYLGSDGVEPVAPLLLDSAGNVYGTTVSGRGSGVVFELTKPPSGNKADAWPEAVLISFGYSYIAGANPESELAFDAVGNLIGTTLTGGNAQRNGEVFKLAKNNNWSESEPWLFGGNPDGANPSAGVTIDAAGNIWGTTFGGGAGFGTVFVVTPIGNAWEETIVHTFASSPNASDGANPSSSLLITKDGVFGTTQGGGVGNGVVFKLTPATVPQPLPLLLRKKVAR